MPTARAPHQLGRVRVPVARGLQRRRAHGGRRTLLAGVMTVGLYVTDLAMNGGITADSLIFLALILGAPLGRGSSGPATAPE